MYWAAAFYRTATSAPTIDFDPMLIHSQFCEEPCRWQEVMPPFDADIIKEHFYPDPLKIPDCSKWAPILGYGSLRQLRAVPKEAMDASRFGEDMTLHSHVFPRDTRPIRLANNGLPHDYRHNVLCPATEKTCDDIFQDAPLFAPVFPRIDRSNEKREDLINDNTKLTDEQVEEAEEQGTDSLRHSPSPPWRSDEHKRNPFYNMVCTASLEPLPLSLLTDPPRSPAARRLARRCRPDVRSRHLPIEDHPRLVLRHVHIERYPQVRTVGVGYGYVSTRQSSRLCAKWRGLRR